MGPPGLRTHELHAVGWCPSSFLSSAAASYGKPTPALAPPRSQMGTGSCIGSSQIKGRSSTSALYRGCCAPKVGTSATWASPARRFVASIRLFRTPLPSWLCCPGSRAQSPCLLPRSPLPSRPRRLDICESGLDRWGYTVGHRGQGVPTHAMCSSPLFTRLSSRVGTASSCQVASSDSVPKVVCPQEPAMPRAESDENRCDLHESLCHVLGCRAPASIPSLNATADFKTRRRCWRARTSPPPPRGRRAPTPPPCTTPRTTRCCGCCSPTRGSPRRTASMRGIGKARGQRLRQRAGGRRLLLCESCCPPRFGWRTSCSDV